MRRVNPFDVGTDQDNYFIHLARYMFCARQIKKTQTILEIGCGTGYGARLLADYATEVIAVDKENNLQDTWNKLQKSNLKFLKEIPEKQFDVIVSYEVVEHVPENEVDDYFKLIKKHLKPTGCVFMSTPRAIPMKERSKNRQLEHAKEYSPEEFRELLDKKFSRVFLFAQNDSIISFQNLNMAWNLIAICIP